jgi:hypothetical protein
MRRWFVLLGGSATSLQNLSSVDFITNIAGSSFQHGHEITILRHQLNA